MASTADAAAAEAEAEGPAPPATLQEALASDHFSVETLDLSEQDIGVLDDGIARLVRLTELVLFGNRLHVVPHAILRCTMLRKLDLSDNMLARPPLHLLALPQLRELYLKGNPFIEIFDVPKTLDGFPLLEFVKERQNEDCYYGIRPVCFCRGLLSIESTVLQPWTGFSFPRLRDSVTGHAHRAISRRRSS